MATATYEELLVEVVPTKIDSEDQYDVLHARFGELFRKRRKTVAEERLKELLGVLLQDYDRRHALPPDSSTPAEKLRFLMEQGDRSASDLLPVFGQRSHVNEALNGKRPISADHARKLGELFKLQPGYFV
ncbi:MAG: hypothetical protein NTZ56_15225 [Acidobacteria bacterium]|nr:hypothetical protein [Acidobacteriota bacterium]